MPRSPRPWTRLVAVAVAVAGGCNGGRDDQELVFTDANNYHFSSGFESDPFAVEPHQDVTIDWSAMTVDMRGRPLDPAAVEQVSLLSLPMPIEEVYQRIADNEIGQDAAQDVYLLTNDGGTSALLSLFQAGSERFDLDLFSDDLTWLVSLMNVPDGRIDVLSTAVIVPEAGSGRNEIVFSDGLSELTDVTVDIASATPLTTRAGLGSYAMRWDQVTVDTFGHPFDPLLANELILGRYAGDLASVEANFLQLDTTADELYRMDVFGLTGESLDGAVDADGNSFGGFTTDGTWVVGIVCTECATPVPLILAHVVVEE